MSFTVYSGFKFKAAKSLDLAYKLLPDLRQCVVDTAKDLSNEMLVKQAVYHYDLACLGQLELAKGDYALWTAYKSIRDELNASAKQRSRCFYDMGFNLTLGLTSDRSVIGILFTEQRKLSEAFMAHPDIEEYAYWDNSDQPEGMTDRAWAKRGKQWNEVLPTGLPSRDMLSMTFIEDYVIDFPDKSELIAHCQAISFEKRLHRIAHDATIKKACEELKLTTTSEVLGFVTNSNPEFTKRLDAEKEATAKLLKRTVSIEELQETTHDGTGTV